MKYFYDRQTDSVSLMLSELLDYGKTEELAPGVIAYFDSHNGVTAIEIHGATKIIDTTGLVPMTALAIKTDEVRRRLSITSAGQRAWRSVRKRIGRDADQG